MSLLIKSLACASLLFLSSLSGSEYLLETKAETIDCLQHKIDENQPAVYSNELGEVVWAERQSNFFTSFYWSEKTGTLEINIDEALSHLGFKKYELINTKSLGYMCFPTRIDNTGTVFFHFTNYIDTENTSWPYPNLNKIGVWNKKFGFKLLNVPGIDHVQSIQFSNDLIFIKGASMSGEVQFLALRPVDGRWPWEPEPKAVEEPVKQPPETTPWDALPFGKYGARLHVLGQLVKSTKSADEKKTIMLMTESEIANMLDLLQYDLKRSQAHIKKALSEGKVDLEAEQLQVDTKKHLAALQAYIKTLPKANKCRVDAIYLPSKDWAPKK